MADVTEQTLRPSGGMTVTAIAACRQSGTVDISGGVDGNWVCLQVDANGNLKTTGSGSSGSSMVQGVGTAGAAADTKPVLVGGSDGTNLRTLKTDSAGVLQTSASVTVTSANVLGTGTTGSAIDTHPVFVGGSDGTNLQPLKTDTGGQLKVLVAGIDTVGSAVDTHPVFVAGTDGTNLRGVKTDTSGNVVVQPLGPGGVALQSWNSDSLTTTNVGAAGVVVYDGSTGSRWATPASAPLGGGRGCIANGTGPHTTLNAVTGTGAGAARSWGVMHQNFTLQLTGTGASFSVKLQGSMDNTNFFDMTPDATDGGTIAGVTGTATGLYYYRNRGVLYTRANVVTLGSGNLTGIQSAY